MSNEGRRFPARGVLVGFPCGFFVALAPGKRIDNSMREDAPRIHISGLSRRSDTGYTKGKDFSKTLRMPLQFLRWHYGDGFRRTAILSVNIAIGCFNYFSVLELARTLVSPWHRIIEGYGRGFEPSTFFSTLAGNIISRILGAIVRAVVIVTGLIVSAVAAFVGAVWIALWPLLPLLIPVAFVWGLLLIGFGF